MIKEGLVMIKEDLIVIKDGNNDKKMLEKINNKK